MYQKIETTQGLRMVLIWGLALMLAAATTALAGDASTVVVTPEEATQPVAGAGDQIKVDLSNGCFIEFVGFDKDNTIKDGLNLLAAKCKKNIVPSSQVDGPLQISRLYNVTFEQALAAILGHGFKYEQDGDFVRVYTAEEYKKIKEDPERMIYEVFTLYYISAAEAKKLITPIMSANGRLETTTAASIEFPTGASISSTTGGGDTPAMNDTIMVFDYPERIEQMAAVIKDVDIRPKQVLIEATILAATLTEDSQFGVDWQTLRGTITSLAGITRPAADFLGSMTTGTVTKTGGLTVGVAHDDVGIFIKAVETVTDVTILANPKILAVNKQLGQVYIGKKVGYMSQTTATENFATQSVDFLDTGTKLSFRPYIGNDGYIRMDIHPKDSTGFLKPNDIPDETSAELVTNIIVKDGQTIVIGGLFRDMVKAVRTQVPVLGNLPVVGAAFRGTGDQVERQEVIVLLTPHIIEEPDQTEGDARAEDVRRKRGSARKGMQIIDRPRLAEDAYGRAVKHYVDGDVEAAVFDLKIALWHRPTYLEAIRLMERIVEETDPEELAEIVSRVEAAMDQDEAPNWRRR